MRSTLAVLLTILALAVAGVSADAAGAAPVTHTHRVVVRPVHANGTPVHGYRVTREDDGAPFTCDGASPVAVDANIYFCGYSATYTVACWKSTHHTVLCLRDPRAKRLVRIRYTGTLHHVRAPKHAAPQALRLFDHQECLVRDGGAWGTVVGHPSWIGFYFCPARVGDVYGRPHGDGISRAHHVWTVETVRYGPPQRITERKVATAYYAGTAA